MMLKFQTRWFSKFVSGWEEESHRQSVLISLSWDIAARYQKSWSLCCPDAGGKHSIPGEMGSQTNVDDLSQQRTNRIGARVERTT